MVKRLTVGELRKAMEGVPDELEVRFSSDTVETYEIVLELARRVKYEIPDGIGETGVDYFDIYGNAELENEDW